MQAKQQHAKVVWYRSPVGREQLQVLNQRSDFKGSLQTGGFLGLLALTGCVAYFSAGRLPWPAVVLLFFLHGTCWAFLINGFHEFVHNSVFETKSFNWFFARVFAFLGWYNPYQFWASHTEHHKYTLHPPADLEVVLPSDLSLRGFLQCAFVNPVGFWTTLSKSFRIARGKLEGPWENALFPSTAVQEKRRLVGWSRELLAGHSAIVLVSILLHLWLVPVVITLAPFYGGWLHYLCNNSQHAGLQDNVPDFRLCCRTITLNPFLSFLYWHMNYHTEHHMYAAVPCYRLGELHALIRHDLPPSPHGLYATWKQIAGILHEQRRNPEYQYVQELPAHAVAASSPQ